jgi:hypothetical protein
MEPQDSVGEPQGSVTEPQDPVMEPQDSVGEPQDLVGEPQDLVGEPQGSVTEPQGSAAEPQDSTAESPDPTIEEQVAIIKEEIIQKYPALLDDSLSDFERTNILRDWAYANTNFAAGNYNFAEHLKRELSLADNFINLTSKYRDYKVQGYCDSAAFYLCCVYDTFGYETAVLHLAVGGEASHTLTLCRLNTEEGKWIVQDPTYNLVYTNKNGQPLDIYEIMTLLKQRQDRDIYYTFGDTQARYIVFDNLPNVAVVDDPSTIVPNTLNHYVFLPGEVKEINGKYGVLYDMRQPGAFQAQVQDILEKTLGQDGYPATTDYLFLRPVNISDSNIADPAAMLEELQTFASDS